jgi:subtilisin-like proprotein convertase family protein
MAGLWEVDTLAVSSLANSQYPTYSTNWQYIFPHSSVSGDGDNHSDMAVDAAGSGKTGNNTGSSPIVCEVINTNTTQVNHLLSLNGSAAVFRGIFRFYTEHSSERHFELHPAVGLYVWNGSAFVLDTDYHGNITTDANATTHTDSTMASVFNGSQTMTATLSTDNVHVDFVFPSPSVNYVQYTGTVLSPVTADATSSYFLFRPSTVPSATVKCRLVADTTAAGSAGTLVANQSVTVNALTRTDMAAVGAQIDAMVAGDTLTFQRPVELIVLGLPGIGAVPTPTPTPTATATPTATINPTPTPTPGATPTPTPSTGTPVLISEFRTRGPAGGSDEFVELYNNSNSAVDIGGWKIKGSNNAGAVSTRLTVTAGTTIPARGHFLATNSTASTGYSGSVAGNQTYSTGITDDGGIAVTLADDTIIDQVGMSMNSAFKEGATLTPLAATATNQSYERKPGGSSGSTQDTNTNTTDFQVITPSDPQNLLSSQTPGGSPTPTPTPTATPTPTPAPTPGPTTTVFSNPSAITFAGALAGNAKGSPYPSTINVTGVPGTISKVTVQLTQLSADRAQDADIMLVSPTGQAVMLMSDCGGDRSTNNATFTFDDSASGMLQRNGRLNSGTYLPSNYTPLNDKDAFPTPAPAGKPASTLSTFNGSIPNGTWSLYVIDENISSAGSISGGWTLTITANPSALTVTTTTGTGVSSSSATLNGLINPLGLPSVWAFQYGTTSTYSDTQADQDGGSGTAEIPVNLSLAGLNPNTTYHFRLTGRNAVGSANGVDVSFSTAAFVDSDGDGMPDDYETANSFDPQVADGAADSDGDGMTNKQEYLAATNPRDPTSVLRISEIRRSGDDILITFPTVFAKRYRLEQCSDLATGVWSTVEDNIAGTGGSVTSFDFAVSDVATVRMYHVVVLP